MNETPETSLTFSYKDIMDVATTAFQREAGRRLPLLPTDTTVMTRILQSRLVKSCGRAVFRHSLAHLLSGLVIVLAASVTVLSSMADEPEMLKAPFDAAAAKSKQQQWAKHLKREIVETNSIGMKLALIPPGEFTMGSPEKETDRGTDERQHQVRITQPFYLGVYDVTLGNYLAFCLASGYKTEAESDGRGGLGCDSDGKCGLQKPEYTFRHWGKKQTNDHPVVNVSWNDAVEFCKWLSKKEGKTYRLPTEVEWEYGCRAGTTTVFHFGDSLSSNEANFNGNYPYGGPTGPNVGNTTVVGSYRPNAFGLYDMHGNAYQWCQDWYNTDYHPNSPTIDRHSSLPSRVVRGSSWFDLAMHCRSANRWHDHPTVRGFCIGFRVVCER